jgi:hypothetical protein
VIAYPITYPYYYSHRMVGVMVIVGFQKSSTVKSADYRDFWAR